MISKSYNVNSDFVPVSTVSQKREPIPYICGLGARVGYERVYANIQTAATKVTNIGDRLSFRASVLSQQIRALFLLCFLFCSRCCGFCCGFCSRRSRLMLLISFTENIGAIILHCIHLEIQIIIFLWIQHSINRF